jgi:hypothetical protein
MNGHELPDGGIVAYLYRGLFSIEFKVLRISGYYRTGEDAAILPDPRALHNGYVAADPGPCSNFYILMDHRERVHSYVGRQPGVRVNGGERMDHSTINWLIFSFLDHYGLCLSHKNKLYCHKYPK